MVMMMMMLVMLLLRLLLLLRRLLGKQWNSRISVHHLGESLGQWDVGK